MMKRFTTLLIALTFALPSFAQLAFTLNGKLLDSEKQPVFSGDVFLYESSGKKLLFSTQVSNGDFQFDAVPAGTYLLRVVSMGFTDKRETVILEKNTLLTLTLEADAATLGTVTVSARKNPFTYKNGNIVANMDSPLFSTVNDPVLLLSKIPGVQVSSNSEVISVVGKGQPLIYLNNQRVTLQDVKSLAVSDIESIELINDPSARYEADGRVVLLIRTKKSGREGFKGEVTQTAAVRKYYLNRAAANASYRKKNLELKGNIQFNHLETWEGNDFDFQIPSRAISSGYSVTAVTSRWPQVIAGAGIFYQLNDLDYLSANTSLRSTIERFPIYTHSYLRDQTRHEDVFTENFNRSPENYKNANINFNKGFRKSNANLFAGLQYTNLTENVQSSIFNTLNSSMRQLSQERRQHSSIDVIAGRLDFEKKWKNDMGWESGSSMSFASSDGLSNIYGVVPSSTIRTVYNYEEFNGAAYSQLSGKKKKINWSAGMRVETTKVQGDYDENTARSAISKNNTNLFPRASITYAPDSLKSFGIRYSKNINRQNYSNANQTVVYINPYFEWANNINLNPSIFQEVVATFQYRNYKLEASVFHHKGAVNSNFTFDDQRGVLRRTELNYKRESGIFVGTTVPFRVGRWSSTNIVNFIFLNLYDPSAITGRARPFVYANSSNELTLPANFVLTASAWAVTKSSQGVFERNALFAVDTSVSKKINRFTCSFRIDDVFASVNAKERFTINDVAAAGKFYDNIREFSLSVKYSFGRLKESTFRNRDVDDNSNRVR